jgi:hypothetical protein
MTFEEYLSIAKFKERMKKNSLKGDQAGRKSSLSNNSQ